MKSSIIPLDIIIGLLLPQKKSIFNIMIHNQDYQKSLLDESLIMLDYYINNHYWITILIIKITKNHYWMNHINRDEYHIVHYCSLLLYHYCI